MRLQDVEDFYPLSPLQQGLLFHSLSDPTSRMYFASRSTPSCKAGGGRSNTASDFYATVGGGRRNDAFGRSSVVGGGQYNNAFDGVRHGSFLGAGQMEGPRQGGDDLGRAS